MKSGPVIGIVGQVCAGKGTVAGCLGRRGARVLDADRLVHALYERQDVKEDVKRVFGTDVFDAGGRVDRSKLASVVFGQAERLTELTPLLYPRVAVEVQAAKAEFAKSADPALVLDAPTLFEAGTDGQCDRILFVAAPIERREAWAAGRNWPPGEIARREQWMMDEESKRTRCNAVIDNRGSVEDLERQVGVLWSKWVARDGKEEESNA